VLQRHLSAPREEELEVLDQRCFRLVRNAALLSSSCTWLDLKMPGSEHFFAPARMFIQDMFVQDESLHVISRVLWVPSCGAKSSYRFVMTPRTSFSVAAAKAKMGVSAYKGSRAAMAGVDEVVVL